MTHRVHRRGITILNGGIELVSDGKCELARIVRAAYMPEKSTFVTPEHLSQQLGFIVVASGSTIKPHRHNEIRREVFGTPEVITVRSGRCAVDLYSDSNELVISTELLRGDVIALVAGGHGFRMLEDTTLMEVKQGPYSPLSDKVHF